MSSVFDFLTFGALLLVFHAAPDLFRTGWFVESLLTELVIALVVRTRRPFFRSRPGRVLLWSTVALVALTLAIPYLPFIGVFGFVPLPGMVLITVMAITALYVGATEMTKLRFYRHVLSREAALATLTVAIPYLPFNGVLGFVPLPGLLLITVTAITALYVVATELTKRRFYRGVV